jgi:hypothetical protein
MCLVFTASIRENLFTGEGGGGGMVLHVQLSTNCGWAWLFQDQKFFIALTVYCVLMTAQFVDPLPRASVGTFLGEGAFLFIYLFIFLRHTSTLSYLNGNKDLDHIFDSLADRYQPRLGVQPPELIGASLFRFVRSFSNSGIASYLR